MGGQTAANPCQDTMIGGANESPSGSLHGALLRLLTHALIIALSRGLFGHEGAGSYFPLCEDELITRIDQRFTRLMNWPLDHGEALQILHYGIGGEYSAHFDFFTPDAPGSVRPLAMAGQRISTLVMYLNDVEAGGETYFPETGLAVMPKKGQVLYFHYQNAKGQLDLLTLHGSTPVTAGEK